MENSEKSLAKAQQSQLYWTMTVTWICSITIANIEMDKKTRRRQEPWRRALCPLS